MASYEKTKDWTVRYRVKTDTGYKHMRKGGFETKKDAERWYAKYSLQQESNSPLTVDMLTELFLDYKKGRVKDSTLYNYERAYDEYVKDRWNKRADKLTTSDVHDWQVDLKKKYRYNTLKNANSFLSMVYNYGIKHRGLIKNPVRDCGILKNTEPVAKLSYWTEEEFLRFLSVIDDEKWKVFFAFLYLTGTRLGEAAGVTWEDYVGDTIKINKQIVRRRFTTTKTMSSNRDILLPKSLIELLDKFKNSCMHVDGYKETNLIFGAKPITSDAARKQMAKYCKISRVDKIKIHDLRHSHASLLINKGQNILIVSQRLGHKSIQETLNTYTHLFPSTQKTIIDAIDLGTL